MTGRIDRGAEKDNINTLINLLQKTLIYTEEIIFFRFIITDFAPDSPQRLFVFRKCRNRYQRPLRSLSQYQCIDKLRRTVAEYIIILRNILFPCQFFPEFPTLTVRIGSHKLHAPFCRLRHPLWRAKRIDIDRKVQHILVSVYISAMSVFHRTPPSLLIHISIPRAYLTAPNTISIKNAVTYISRPVLLMSSGSTGRRASPINSFLYTFPK